MLSDAIRQSKDGALIEFEVTPGAKELRVPSGYNEWRKRIEAHLSEAPVKGRANEQLLGAVAGILNIPRADVELVSGARSTQKTVLVRGMPCDIVLGIFAEALEVLK